jgi:hypothetical protein
MSGGIAVDLYLRLLQSNGVRLHTSPIGYPFHPAILNIQIFPHCVYTDATGVLWGVPDEFKAKNQITAGFESALI